jgi:hypothetical protein
MPEITGEVGMIPEYFHSKKEFCEVLDKVLEDLREDFIKRWEEWNASRPDAN